MSHGFLPRTDAALLAFARNFSQLISLAPGDYGLSAGHAAQFSALTDDFATKLRLCSPQIRNKVAVSMKNAARVALKSDAVRLKNIIDGQTNVTDAQKTQLGLNVRKAPTAAPAPSSAPVLGVSPAPGQNTVTVRLRQADHVGRARPRSAIGAMIFTFVGDSAPTHVDDWRFHSLASTTSIDITFNGTLTPGTKVWFTANWFGSRKQIGPMAAPIYTHLAGGGVELPALRMAA